MNRLRKITQTFVLSLALAVVALGATADPIAQELPLERHPLIGSEWNLNLDHIYTTPAPDMPYGFEVMAIWEPTTATVQSILLQMDGSLKIVFRLESGAIGYVYVASLNDLDDYLGALPHDKPVF